MIHNTYNNILYIYDYIIVLLSYSYSLTKPKKNAPPR